jgi:predicted MFS family arabinose efflux permease
MLAALSAFNHLDRQLMNILLEPVRREFALSDIQLGLLSGFSFAVVYTAFGIPAALWAAHADRRRLVAGAALLWGVMTMICGAAQSFAQLLLARIGVGIGEAGGPAPSQAMLSDLYEPGERATAMAVYYAGVNVGGTLAFLVGGLVGQFLGWRAAFAIAGFATILLALATALTVRDPARSADPLHTDAPDAPQPRLVKETMSAMIADPVLRHLCIGATLLSLVAYTVLAWVPSYLIRSHGLSIAATGVYLAAVFGVGGAIGTYAGGRVADALRKHDARWSLWLTTAAFVAGTPLIVGFYLSASTVPALALFVFPAMVGAIFLGPSIAVLHDRVAVRQRPVASAIFILLVTLVGLGLGPLVAGALSQHVFAALGTDSLRYALSLIQFAGLWGALHFWIAGRQLAGATP